MLAGGWDWMRGRNGDLYQLTLYQVIKNIKK
jgi:hypothetical protein